jgi:hypothetical protein
MEGTPPLRGVPYPVFKCGFSVKVNVNTAFDFGFAEINKLTLTF